MSSISSVQNPNFQLKEFITSNFKKRTCTKFVPENSSSSMCGCGYDHEQDTESSTAETTETWDIQRHTETSTTDAFGEVDFDPLGNNRAMYVRVDYETEISDLVTLLLHHWKMKTPRLLISVIGGVQDFKMKPLLEHVICQGLVKAAESMHTWIITGGTNRGVTKYVCKALRRYTIKHGSKKQLVALGIATWGCIANRDCLIPDEVRIGNSKEGNGCWPASYQVTDSQDKENESPLDPNHTHFILVDNGTQKQFGVEIELRAQLEREISKTVSDEQSDSIPVVCVVLEGGPDTLMTVKETVENETPVVIVKGSGGAADVLAFAYEKFQQHEGQEEIDARQRATNDLWNKVASQIRVKFGGDLSESYVETYVGYIRVCVENIHLLSIFDLERGSSAIDVTILNAALPKVNCGIDQLWLALAFDRIDVAKEIIFTDGVSFEESELDELMSYATLNNRVAFVKLFREKGVDLPTFVGNEKIICEELYQIPWVKAMVKTKSQEKTIKSLLKYFGLRETDHWPDYVFLWSVLAMHRELSMVILSEREEVLALVGIAHSISRTLLKKVPDPEFNKELSEQVTFYEELAVGLLSEYYLSDQRKAMQLIVTESERFGIIILEMAGEADNNNFVAHPVCQKRLTEVWTGKLSDDNRPFRLLTSIICPFVAPLLLKFRDNTTFRSVSATNDSSVTWTKHSSQTSEISCNAYSKKLFYFFQAPEIKFSYNFLSQLVFLLLYAVILLTDFYPKIGTREIIFCFWVAAVGFEEIRQIVITFDHYVAHNWIILDGIRSVTFLAGMILRSISVSTCGQCFFAARIILALNFMTFFFRILYMFSVHRELGPKLVMIGKMMIDLFYFMIILFVFIAAYGIASHVILYPNQPLNIALARDVLSRSWWNIFGELGIDEVSGEACDNRTLLSYAEQCASMNTEEFSSYGCSDYKADKCPSIDWLVPIILAIYVLIANVLMINLLIAMFSNTLSNIQGQTNVIWKMQRFHLVREYETRAMLPPPLSICYIPIYILVYCGIICYTLCSDESEEASLDWDERYELLRWEKQNAEEYLQKRSLHSTAGGKERDSNDKLDLILSKQEEISRMHRSETKSKLDLIVDKLEEMSKRLTQLEKQGNKPKEEVKTISGIINDSERRLRLTEEARHLGRIVNEVL